MYLRGSGQSERRYISSVRPLYLWSTLTEAQLSTNLYDLVPLPHTCNIIKKMMRQLSKPGWALSAMAALTIMLQAPNIYNPFTIMDDFNISNKADAQLIGKSESYTRDSCYAAIIVSSPLPLKAPETDIVFHVAFLLVLINGYDMMGALEDNWTVYWFSLTCRAVAMASREISW